VTLQALTVITAAVALGLGASTALAAVQVPWATQAGGGNADNGNAISTLPDGSSIVTGDFRDTATFGSTTLTSAGGSLDVFVAKFLVAPQAAAATTTTTLRPTVLPSRTRLISGQAMRLGIRTTNTGTATAASVTSCLSLSQNLVVTRTAGATRTGRTLCFALGDLPAGATRTKVVTVRAVAIRSVTRRVTGTVQSSATNPALTTTQSRAIRISPRTARTPVTG
jgi:hypothetical protein